MKINQLRLKDKKNYLIVDSNSFNTENEFLDAIADKLNNGVQIIELRESFLNAQKIIRLSKKIRELCSIFNALFIINDRIDIAQIVHADGVVLDENSIDVLNTRELLGNETIIGSIVSNIDDATKAVKEGVDYLILCDEKINIIDIHSFKNSEITKL